MGPEIPQGSLIAEGHVDCSWIRAGIWLQGITPSKTQGLWVDVGSACHVGHSPLVALHSDPAVALTAI